MTYPINCITGKKHRQLACQVKGVIKINPSGLMASFDISAVTFIPGMEFIFGSLSFVWRRLGLARSDPIRPTASSRVSHPSQTQTGSKQESHYPAFQFRNSANTYQYM